MVTSKKEDLPLKTKKKNKYGSHETNPFLCDFWNFSISRADSPPLVSSFKRCRYLSTQKIIFFFFWWDEFQGRKKIKDRCLKNALSRRKVMRFPGAKNREFFVTVKKKLDLNFGRFDNPNFEWISQLYTTKNVNKCLS